MEYTKFGTSKNYLVFLHGWGADRNSFLWTQKYFLDYSLVYVDFSGFGHSKPPSRPYFVNDYVKELKQLLDNFDIESLVLIGHSFGGRVAVKFASIYQQDYNKFALVLVDAAGMKPHRGICYKIKVAKYKRCKRLATKNEKYKRRLEKFGSPDFKVSCGVMRQTLVNVVNENLEPYAKNILCKTCLIWGKNDKDTKMYMAKKFSKLIKNSKLYVIDGAGHFSFLDKPQEFLIILDTFVKNL